MDERALDAILSRMVRIDPPEALAMRVTWERQDPKLRRAAWQIGSDAIVGTDGEDAVKIGREAVERWIRDAGAGGTVRTLDSTDRIGGLDARIAAAPAILDAILAVAAGTALDQDQRHLLLAPWWSVLAGQEQGASRSRRGRRRRHSA